MCILWALQRARDQSLYIVFLEFHTYASWTEKKVVNCKLKKSPQWSMLHNVMQKWQYLVWKHSRNGYISSKESNKRKKNCVQQQNIKNMPTNDQMEEFKFQWKLYFSLSTRKKNMPEKNWKQWKQWVEQKLCERGERKKNGLI